MLKSPLLAAAIMIPSRLSLDAASAGDSARVPELLALMDGLRPLHTALGKPGPGDWLASHPEPGQTFRQYLRANPATPSKERHVLYIQPLGNLTQTQRRIIALTAEFMGCYFSLPVKIDNDIPLSLVPSNARRRHPSWGTNQILTTYVLDRILKPNLPDDAFACIALTTSDLWPGPGWNFVFGQASLRNRVGVWSIYRNGDPHKDQAGFRLCLLRTMKTATHEVGHMFSMLHCIKYECGMNGSNHLQEKDRRPLALCPECLAKLLWATNADPVQRYRKLAAFCKEHGLNRERRLYQKSIPELSGRDSERAR